MRELLLFLWKLFATIIAYCYDKPEIVLFIGVLTVLIEFMFEVF